MFDIVFPLEPCYPNAIKLRKAPPIGSRATMSYYFCIVGTKDNPLFELEFGTSKQGGDGVARFSAEARRMNPFIVHSSLDIVDETQWYNSQMYVTIIRPPSSVALATSRPETFLRKLYLIIRIATGI